MSTVVDTALRSVFGLVVVAAMFVTIWATRDSSARTGAAAGAAVASESKAATLNSARNDRAPVTRTSLTPEQLHGRRALSAD